MNKKREWKDLRKKQKPMSVQAASQMYFEF
jgi:hypothetical protein